MIVVTTGGRMLANSCIHTHRQRVLDRHGNTMHPHNCWAPCFQARHRQVPSRHGNAVVHSHSTVAAAPHSTAAVAPHSTAAAAPRSCWAPHNQCWAGDDHSCRVPGR